jgi:hypothetical protein
LGDKNRLVFGTHLVKHISGRIKSAMRGATRIYHFFAFGFGSVVVGHINAATNKLLEIFYNDFFQFARLL